MALEHPTDEDVQHWKDQVKGNIWRGGLILAFILIITGYALGTQLSNNTNNIKEGYRQLHQTQDELQQTQNALSNAEKLLTTSLVGACHRTNVIRAADNRSHLDDYLLYSEVARVFGKFGPPAFEHHLEEFAEDKEWQPLVKNCVQTVTDSDYTAPRPVKFSERLPTQTDLRVGADG